MRVLGVIVGLCVVVGLWFWFDRAPEQAPFPAAASGDARGVDSASAPIASAELSTRDPASGTQRESFVGSGTGRRADPAIQKALGGFTGRIVLQDAIPVEGVRVRIYRGDFDALLRPGVDYLSAGVHSPDLIPVETTTGDDGRFDFRGVWPRSLYLLRADVVDATARDERVRLGSGTYRVIETTPAPGEIVDLGDVALELGAVLSGRVVDVAGKPVGGALVRAVQAPDWPFQATPLARLDPDGGVLIPSGTYLTFPPWLPELLELLPLVATETNPDGTFRLFAVDPGRNALIVTTPGRPAWSTTGIVLEPGERRTVADIVMLDGSDARVRVEDAAERPVAGVEVIVGVVALGDTALITARGETDAHGELRAGGFAAGDRIRAAIRQRGAGGWTVGEPGRVEDGQTFVLGTRHSLTVRVVDVHGALVRQPELRVIPGSRGLETTGFAMLGVVEPVPIDVRKSRRENGDLQIEGLASGTYTLVARAVGHAVGGITVELQQDRTEIIELRPARRLAVEVRDPGDRPLPNAGVFALPRGPRERRLSSIPLNCGVTDREGSLIVDDLPTVRARITARHPVYGAVHAETKITESVLVLRMAEPGVVRGVLLEGGIGPDPGKWMLVLERQRVAGAVPELPQMRTPGPDGRFRFASVQPGRYRVTAHHSMNAINGIDSAVTFFSSKNEMFPFLHREIDVSPGIEVEVELDAYNAMRLEGPGANIRGTVLLNGRPGSGLIVTAETEQGPFRAGKVGIDGRFDLGHVLAGSVKLQVLPSRIGETRRRELVQNRYWQKRVQLVGGSPRVFDVEITTDNVVGMVSGPDGTALAGAEVWLRPASNDGTSAVFRARSDAEGKFAIPRVPAGRYTVVASRRRVGRGSSPDVVVSGSGLATNADVGLRAYVIVRGRIPAALFDGQRKGLAVRLVPLAGPGTLQRTVTAGIAADGAFVARDVIPGPYKAVMFGPGSQIEHDGTVDVGPGGLEGLLLRPK